VVTVGGAGNGDLFGVPLPGATDIAVHGFSDANLDV
jgi:hypothetical protein